MIVKYNHLSPFSRLSTTLWLDPESRPKKKMKKKKKKFPSFPEVCVTGVGGWYLVVVVGYKRRTPMV
jgi:hypothetical protein